MTLSQIAMLSGQRRARRQTQLGHVWRFVCWAKDSEHGLRQNVSRNELHQGVQPHHALTAYFLAGKWMSFFRCFEVLSEASCWKNIKLEEMTVKRTMKTHPCQTSSDCSCLLRPEIKRQVFLALVMVTQSLPCFLVHHSQHPGY
jgi:hypothetical protein